MGKVLQFRVFAPINSLRLREIADGEVGEITKWFRANRGASAKFRIRVGHMRQVERVEWHKKWFRSLGGGIFEIKWTFEKKQCRIIGFDHEESFLMLLGCTHKQGVYEPHNWLETAKRLKGEVEYGKWGKVDYNL